ncbi:hypothetical protein RB653_000560 [Dictyostelium firmibasis]|uniref:Uncharacterized protein n=1 Tax=Dictyostelium firmibasis TaxID=79012 RepID=A0AAN7U314_9MYCE
MSFSSSLIRCAIMTNSSGANTKFIQYYPVHKFNKMQYNEKKQHMKFQKSSNPIPAQSKLNTNTNTNQLNSNSNYLVVDDA